MIIVFVAIKLIRCVLRLVLSCAEAPSPAQLSPALRPCLKAAKQLMGVWEYL